MSPIDLKFMELVDLFIISDQLGDYDLKNYSITLYDIKNDSKTRSEIHKKVKSLFNSFRIIPTSDEEITNIKILDIGL